MRRDPDDARDAARIDGVTTAPWAWRRMDAALPVNRGAVGAHYRRRAERLRDRLAEMGGTPELREDEEPEALCRRLEMAIAKRRKATLEDS